MSSNPTGPRSKRLALADVALDSRMAGSEAIYTYAATPDAKVGQARMVPLGPRYSLGYVLELREAFPQELGFPPEQLRRLGPPVDGLAIPPNTLELVAETARQTLTSIPLCLGLATPPGVKDRLATVWVSMVDVVPPDLSTAQDEALRALIEAPLVVARGKAIHPGLVSAIRALQRKGLVERRTQFQAITRRAESRLRYHLTPDSARIDAYIRKHAKKRPAQVVTLINMQGSESAAFSVEEIRALGQVSDSTVKGLITQGLLVPAASEPEPPKTPPTPNEHQQSAIDSIERAVRDHRAETFLLYGVTGSGKTEVFLRAAETALSLGRQVLYLVPEIALTAQVVAQLRNRFGERVAMLHSNLSAGERMDNWLRAASGEAPVVLGPRSALFAPLPDIGLIVMDEEHEASYKQESAPRYHARSLARWLAQRMNCPLVLGSATPSVETMFAARAGEINLLTLPVRAASAQLPSVEIEDLREAYKDRSADVFSPRLATAIEQAIERKEQTILFLNRRAFAPFVVCRDCGHRFECPRCAVSLALHRGEKRLKCHHCDFSIAAPEACPDCGGTRVNAFGIGAEKVEQAVTERFEGARVARLDRDIARRKGALEEILAQFRMGGLDVLVGTQMVAKGLDFPNVTVVGVIAADIGLSVPDFRASERTFQLLSQVAGRAGRGQRPGRVVIQTLSPEHPSVEMARRHDYDAFYAALIQERQAAGYPPYRRLVNIVFSGPDRGKVYEASAVAGQRLKHRLSGEKLEILGPVDCPLSKLSNQYRRHVLIKMAPGADPAPVAAALADFNPAAVRITLDVDPYNLI